MNPIDKLIRLIDPESAYTISELHSKCAKAGITISRSTIYKDVLHGKIEAVQKGIGGDWYIQGATFVKIFVSNKEK